MIAFTESAPAKINLTLQVIGRRADGFHELRSVVAFARDAADVVELRPANPPDVTVDGPFGGAIEGDNILERTLELLSTHGLATGAVRLTKNLPVASGIGGGSADAAALLRAARRAYSAEAGRIAWHEIAARLGADVPMCLESRPALVTGTGTCVRALPQFAELNAVLANPLAPVGADKTARVFRALGLAPGETLSPASTAADFSDATDCSSAANLIGAIAAEDNDLTRAACEVVPAVPAVLSALARLPGCRLARMSGAGPTCFGLFNTLVAAQAAANDLRVEQPDWWVTATRLG